MKYGELDKHRVVVLLLPHVLLHAWCVLHGSWPALQHDAHHMLLGAAAYIIPAHLLPLHPDISQSCAQHRCSSCFTAHVQCCNW
jgi:hypothetical protein